MEELLNFTETLESIPEPLQGFYKEVEGGGYKLQVKNMVEKATVDEFRTNNIRLKQENEELAKKLSEVNQVRQAKPVEEIDRVIEAKTKEIRENFTNQLTEAQQKLADVEGKYRSVIFSNTVTDAAIKAGVRSEALTDVENRIRSVFKFEDGNLIAKDSDGNTILAKDGSGPKSVAEYINDLKSQAPHFFPISTGGGSPGNNRTGSKTNYDKMSAFEKIRAGLSA